MMLFPFFVRDLDREYVKKGTTYGCQLKNVIDYYHNGRE